jgi:hypothetical protein
LVIPVTKGAYIIELKSAISLALPGTFIKLLESVQNCVPLIELLIPSDKLFKSKVQL